MQQEILLQANYIQQYLNKWYINSYKTPASGAGFAGADFPHKDFLNNRQDGVRKLNHIAAGLKGHCRLQEAGAGVAHVQVP
jgi:hypothetical protein